MSLQRLLEQAHPRPETLMRGGADALTLALHCLMVEHGFAVFEESSSGRPSKYTPPKKWNKVEHEWVFEYTKPGKSNKFVLHCSLPPNSFRMFVHASELENLRNIQILGLQLDNYVPEAEKLQQGSWKDVIQNQDKLVELFKVHILEPLDANAEELQDTDSFSPMPVGDSVPASRKYLLPVLAASAAVVLAIVVFRYRRHA